MSGSVLAMRPDVRLDDTGLTTADLATSVQCSVAFMGVTRQIINIEDQLAELEDGDSRLTAGDLLWRRSAKKALRYKRAALQQIQIRQAALAKAERAIVQVTRERVHLEMIRELAPAAFFAALEEGTRRYPSLFEPASSATAGDAP